MPVIFIKLNTGHAARGRLESNPHPVGGGETLMGVAEQTIIVSSLNDEPVLTNCAGLIAPLPS